VAAAVARDFALGIAAAVTAGAVSWSAYMAALLGLPAARVATRWCAAALLALWSAVALFWLLTPLHAFRLPVVLGIAVLAVALLHRAAGRRENVLDRLGRDARAARELVASLGGGERWLADPANRYSPLDSAKFLLGLVGPSSAFLNPGPAALVVIVLGAWALARSRGAKLLAGLFLAAATTGFESVGHNWYLYPLLGSRLQNRVLYVPVTRGGEVVDYRSADEVRRRADRRCWMARLRIAGVDAVASLAPRTTVEEEWMREAPEIFRPVVVTPDRTHALYDVDRGALAAEPSAGCGALDPPGGATS